MAHNSLVSIAFFASKVGFGAVCYLVKNSSGTLIGVATGVPDEKCVYRNWEMTLKNGNRFGQG